MRIVLIICFALLSACGPPPDTGPEPPVPDPADAWQEAKQAEDPYQRWMMNEYDIWKFLKDRPEEQVVRDTFGQPDSVFVDFNQTYRILYYYIPKINDYNSIEIDLETGRATGFEWD